MRNLLKSVVLFLLAIISLNACKSERDKNLIKIGVNIDLTGKNSVYGEQVKKGVDLAVSYINDSLNIGKEVIIAKYLDSKDTDKEAINNLNKQINIDEIHFFIGGISSNVVKSMIPTIENSNSFLFAPASSSSILTNVSEHFARNWPSDDLEAGFAAKYAINNFKSQKPLVAYVNSYYGIGLKDKFKSEVSKMTGIKVEELSFEAEQSNFRTLIEKIKITNPDCIYLAGNPKEMGRFMKQLQEQNLNINIISNTGFLQPDCLNVAKTAANDVIVPTPNPTSQAHGTIDSVRNFEKLYRKKYKGEPTLVTANAFDAVMLIYDAIQKNGQDPLKVAKEIRNKKGYDGASGIVDFENGDIQTEIIYKIVKDGSPINLEL